MTKKKFNVNKVAEEKAPVQREIYTTVMIPKEIIEELIPKAKESNMTIANYVEFLLSEVVTSPVPIPQPKMPITEEDLPELNAVIAKMEASLEEDKLAKAEEAKVAKAEKQKKIEEERAQKAEKMKLAKEQRRIFSQNLKYLRKTYDITMHDFVDMLEIKPSVATISAWETARYFPRPEALQNISELFDISILDLGTKRLWEEADKDSE